MAQLRSYYSKIKEAGGEVLLVSFYPPDRAAHWARRFDLPFMLASDTTRDTYRRYGLLTSKGVDASTFASVMEGIKGFMKVGRIPEHIQHWDQLGGYFAVDNMGKTLYAHVCENAIDNPPLSELLAAMQVTDRQVTDR